MPPSATYLAKFNNYTLPGYVQSESMDSIVNIATHNAAYVDGGLSEDIGLENKVISLRLKVWEADYDTCVEKIRLAGTMLRSIRTFAPLYIKDNDKHYTALVKSVTRQQEAGTSTKISEYEVQFECKPWLERDMSLTISGVSGNLITTDDVSRSINNGGWSPVTLSLHATSAIITVSGYLDDGTPTGYIMTSGVPIGTYCTVDSEAFTFVNASGVNINQYVLTPDYRMYVGPGKTSFEFHGVDECIITWNDRWYI